MNLTHVHLALNHVPVLGTVFGLGLLAYALWRKSEEIKRVAVGVFVLAALSAIPVYLTGEPAEDTIKGLPGISRSLIGRHEDAADQAFTGVLAIGGLALFGLIRFRGRKLLPAWFTGVLLVLSLLVSGLMVRAANFGGQIRHPEIRPQVGAPAASPKAGHE